MQTATNFYSFSFTEGKTYLWAVAFVIGNMLFPQLFHLIPKGGLIFLPIYFFTLLGAYKFGWKVGLLTAVFSPIINSALFGMPMMASLPIILAKSVILAIAAGYTSSHFHKATLPLVFAVVAFYQLAGGLIEWFYTGSLYEALQDVRIGFPGIIIQIVGCWLLINYVFKK